MAIIRGQLLAFSWGGVQVEDQIDGEITFESDMDEATSKDSSGNWRDFLYGLKGWSGSCTINYDPVATEGVDEAIDELIAGTTATLLFTTGVTSNREWTGTALVQNVSIQAPLSGPATASIQFQGTGTPTAQNS